MAYRRIAKRTGIFLLSVHFVSMIHPVEGATWVGHKRYSGAEWVLVDTDTGESTIVPADISGYFSLALAPGGTLYALENGVLHNNDPYFRSRLYAVDTTTFAATKVAEFETDGSFQSLTFTSDGSLLATGNPSFDEHGTVTNSAIAYRIDPYTFSIEEIGNWYSHGLATAPVDVEVAGLGTVPAGTFFGNYFNALWIMDPLTGERTTIESSVNQINVDYSLAFGPDGTLYTTYGIGGNVYRVDLATMTQAKLYSHQASFTFRGGEVLPSAVPEPSSLVLWTGLGVMGLVAARRRRRTT